MTPTRKVLSTPAPGTIVHPVHTYTEEQTRQIEALREFTKTISLPTTDPYYQWQKRWLDCPDTHPRYMRAAKWIYGDAQKRIQATMDWRREYQPDLISPEEVRIEGETGKIILNGFDRDGRPIIYMRPGRENTQQSPRQLRHLVWWLERAKDFMPPGQETLVIVVDYKSVTLRTNPSISVARKVLNILQQHYVETLGRAVVVNLPTLLSFFYKGIERFLDPVTRDKMRFNPNLVDLVPENQLDADFGGSYEFEYEPNTYWDQVIEICGIASDGTRTPVALPATPEAEAAEGTPTTPETVSVHSRMDSSGSGSEDTDLDTPKTARSVVMGFDSPAGGEKELIRHLKDRDIVVSSGNVDEDEGGPGGVRILVG
ncbi:CRAL/TRIO domain-containing protein [Coprinopsis marcescibilis]|uniref:CRAL/TRIO domain-containing protein n=1 Tax=Coprinopsis marcescibilis TaxID=230819 RepID=A0A5C3KUK1_COPMA|nr:CRAL/TRIO domain-containing protein [Coprinopsis marcescibilis]